MTSERQMQVLGLLAGGVVGGLGAGLISSLLAFTLIKAQEDSSRSKWNLVPTVVAGKALAPGEQATPEAVLKRSLPERFVTASLVKEESAAFVLNQEVLVPLGPGDPFHWGFLLSARTFAEEGSVSRDDSAVWKACRAALAANARTAPRERTPADVRARLASEERP